MSEAGERTRAFIAVELDDSCRASLATCAQRLRQAGLSASWVKDANLHITLKFLGPLEPASVELLIRNLAPQFRQLSAFNFSLAGPGLFPERGRPRVLWAGVQNGSGELTKCHEIAEDAARHLTLKQEHKTFSPHITLGRFRKANARQALESILRDFNDLSAGAMHVSHVSLFSSELNAGGSVYRVLERFPLQESPSCP